MCFQGLVEEPVPTAVWLQRLGCFFFSRKKKFSVHMVRARGAIAWRAHVKVLQRDEFFDSVTAAWYEGGS
jgi:hypothetical protein